MARSSNYSPSRHGRGWSSGKPGNAAVNFLNNPNVSNDAKIEYIRNNGATPPSGMLEGGVMGIAYDVDRMARDFIEEDPQVSSREQRRIDAAREREEEEPESLRGQTTTHYLINFCATGFGYNLRRALSQLSEIQRVQQEYRQGS